jgi:hypothetical protein
VSDGQTQFTTGAVRCAGVAGEGDGYPLRYDLISIPAMRRWARTMGEGATKYADRNWEKGIPASNLVNHLLAHVYAWLDGDHTEDHLGHAMFNLAALAHFEETRPELIDIPSRQAP